MARRPPAGTPIPPRGLRALAAARDPAAELVTGLSKRLSGAEITLHASGREALRVALERAATRSGRSEVVVAGYTCYSVPAAAVAAGLRVRLVDVTDEGRLCSEALERAPLERAAAVVVGNLFGLPEPVTALRARLAPHGVALIDDAAQALGAADADGPVGARGDLGVLSFGRGKPLSGLGGGALVWPGRPGVESPAPAAAHFSALARALAYDLALQPVVFRCLSALPFLHIGETPFEPGFARGPIDGAAVCLAAEALDRFDADTAARRAAAEELAGWIEAETGFAPLRAGADASGVYPRLALRAPSAGARETALAELRDAGASPLYPASLDALEPLRPHLADEPTCPRARELASRLLTLPARPNGARPERLLATLASVS